MNTSIKFWQIDGDQPIPAGDTALATSHTEGHLEGWIAKRPDILGDDLLIIAKQLSIKGVGRLDLLALDKTGQFVIVELKRDMAPREAVAQALDYAAWLEDMEVEELVQIAEDYLNGRTLQGAFEDAFPGISFPELTNDNHRIILVSSHLDSAAERIINYLSAHSLKINALFFNYTKLANGQEVLARAALIPESVAASRTPKRKLSGKDVILMSRTRHVEDLWKPIKDLTPELGKIVILQKYGGCLGLARKDTKGRDRVPVVLNVSGKRFKSADGELDVWLRPRKLAQVLGITEDETKRLLETLPDCFASTSRDYAFRIKSVDAAQKIASSLRQWFGKHPGWYK